MRKGFRRPLADRLLSKIAVSERGCHEWTGYRTAAGYGCLLIERVPRQAHRVAYEVHVGPVPAGHDVRHRCGVRACVNPAHLFLRKRGEAKAAKFAAREERLAQRAAVVALRPAPRPKPVLLLAGEEWRDIPGHPGYQASNLGRVRSRYRVLKPRLAWKKGKQQPPRVVASLSVKCVVKKRFVHQIVLEAFVGPRPPGKETAHWDGDPLNNRLENLRWATPEENFADEVRLGRVRATKAA